MATTYKAKKKLTKKQELFCRFYATDRGLFGNGTQAYAKAYNIDLSQKGKKSIAKASASRLLTYDYILDYINKMLDLEGLNDESVDKELHFLIKQCSNLNVKLGAIKEYNSLRKRIIEREEINVKSEVNLTSVLNEIKNKSQEEVLMLLEEDMKKNMRDNACR